MRNFILITILALIQLPLEANWEHYIKPILDNDSVPFYLRKNPSDSVSVDTKQEIKQIVSMDRILGTKAAVVTAAQIEQQDARKQEGYKEAPKPIRIEDTAEFQEQKKVLVQSLPVYSQLEKGLSDQDLEQAKAAVKSAKVIEVIDIGVAPDATIPLTKSGIPVFSLENEKRQTYKDKSGKKKERVVKVKIDKIPRLNIGQVKQISSSGFALPEMKFNQGQYEALKSLQSPVVETKKDLDKLLLTPISKVVDNSKFELKELIEADSLVKKVNSAGYVLVKEANVDLKEINKLSTDEMMFLQAEILYAKADQCHSATGLYYELLDSKNQEYRSTAKLKVGICAHRMGLFTDSVKRLISVLEDKNEEAKKEALKALLADLPLEFQEMIGKYLENFRDYHLLEESDKPAFNYVISKSLAVRDQYSKALQYAEKVPKESKYYSRAQYIASVAEYVVGKVEASFRRQEVLSDYLIKTNKSDEVNSLLAMQMARVNFQRRNYKEAIEKFLEIDRNHPMWLQGLTQQAWAQMMVKDEPGAVGNMHSIHTPFFKAVYKPESYAIRALGYLNLCQYADAYRSIQNLEGVYGPWQKAISSFNKANSKKSVGYYDLVAQYLRNPKQEVVEGVPFQVIREIARHKDFLNAQDAINKTYDEKDQYSFLVNLLNKDRQGFEKLKAQAIDRKKQMLGNLKLAEKDSKLLKNVNQWKLQIGVDEFLIDYYSFRIANYNFAKKGMQKYSKESNAVLEARRGDLKRTISSDLKKRMKKMESEIAKLIQNNELLKYEIFSGAGENIRYRVSGGKTIGQRKPATSELKKEALNWEFDGEFWEDEVGHYRSSLNNVCGKTETK